MRGRPKRSKPVVWSWNIKTNWRDRKQSLTREQRSLSRKQKKRKQGAIDQIMNLEIPKTERKSALGCSIPNTWMEFG